MCHPRSPVLRACVRASASVQLLHLTPVCVHPPLFNCCTCLCACRQDCLCTLVARACVRASASVQLLHVPVCVHLPLCNCTSPLCASFGAKILPSVRACLAVSLSNKGYLCTFHVYSTFRCVPVCACFAVLFSNKGCLCTFHAYCVFHVQVRVRRRL